MNPRRVVEQDPCSLEAELLRAGRAVRAPDMTLKATLGALGLGATAAVGAGGATPAKAWGWFGTLSAKWTTIAVCAVSGAWVAAHVAGQPRSPSQARVETVATPIAVPMAPADTTPQLERTRAAVTPSEERVPFAAAVGERSAPSKPASSPRPSSPKRPSSAAGLADSLGAEVELIDAARRAVDAGQGHRALVLLQTYDAQFKRPRLAHEAAVVRARALGQLARENEARATFVSASRNAAPAQRGEPQP